MYKIQFWIGHPQTVYPDTIYYTIFWTVSLLCWKKNTHKLGTSIDKNNGSGFWNLPFLTNSSPKPCIADMNLELHTPGFTRHQLPGHLLGGDCAVERVAVHQNGLSGGLAVRLTIISGFSRYTSNRTNIAYNSSYSGSKLFNHVRNDHFWCQSHHTNRPNNEKTKT